MNGDATRRLSGLFAVVFLLACGGGGGGGGDGTIDPPDDPPFNGTVDILDNRFSPQHIVISVGDSVTWRWDGNNSHTLTQGTTPSSSQDGTRLFDVPERKNGTFGYRFTTARTVPYFCRKHFYMSMDGTVKVEP